MIDYDLIKSKNGRVYILVEKSNNPNIIKVKDITPENKSDHGSAFEIHAGFHCPYLIRYKIYEEDQTTSLVQLDKVSDMWDEERYLSNTLLISHNINTGELNVTVRKDNVGVEHIVRPYKDESYISKVIITVQDRSYYCDNDIFINFLIVTKEMEEYLKVVKYKNFIMLHDDGTSIVDPESLMIHTMYKGDDLEEL